MFAGTALSVRIFVCAGLSLFIICGPYLSVVVCMFYAYNLTLLSFCLGHATSLMPFLTVSLISEKLEKNALRSHLFQNTWFRLILKFELALYRNH